METIKIVQVSTPELESLISKVLSTQFDQLKKTFEVPIQGAKEILTRKETAELLDMSLVGLHGWMNKGIVTPYKLGNRTYFKRSEIIESLLNSNRQAS